MNDTGKITTVMEPDDENRGKALVPQRFQPPSVPSEPGELSVGDLVAQVRKVQEVMDAVMKRDFHYGVIPGCGDKPTLFKPGAEKLALVFRLCPSFDVTETDLGNGHRHFRVTCVLTHITTGAKIAEGVGYGSTMESKYRWRQGQRKCPKCGKPAIIKGKQEYGGGWLCWPKKDGCNAKWPDGAKEIEGQSVDRVENPDIADTYNCVTPETRLLTHDLRWVPAGDIQTGDVLIGVQEQPDNEYARHLAIGEATVHGTREDTVYEIAFDDGRKVRCNGEHRWLVRKVGLKGTEWVATQDIYREIAEKDGRPRHWCVMSLCRPWEEDASKEAGYVAGLLDADGSLGINQLVVMFAQQANCVLSRMEAALEARGYAIGKSACKTADELARCQSKEQVYGIRVLGGFAEQMRLLGSIRPPRLLERWLTLFDLPNRRLEGRGSGAGRPARIVSVSIVGTEEVVLLGTSCGTYIAEGLVAHNTVLKMAKKRAQIDATLTATGASDIFAQDLEDLAEAAATAAKPPVAERPTEDPHEVIEDAFEQQAPPPQASQPRPRGTAKQRDGFMERMKAAKSYDELQPIYGEFAKPFRWSKDDGMKLHDYYEHRVAEFKAVAEPGAQG